MSLLFGRMCETRFHLISLPKLPLWWDAEVFLEMVVGSLLLSTAGSDYWHSWKHETKLFRSRNFFPHLLTGDTFSYIQTSSKTKFSTSKINNRNLYFIPHKRGYLKRQVCHNRTTMKCMQLKTTHSIRQTKHPILGEYSPRKFTWAIHNEGITYENQDTDIDV
jgi:hypothetical protein